MKEIKKIWRARKWMKSNEPFLYAWHAHVGYVHDLFDEFEAYTTVSNVATKRDMNELLLTRWAEVGVAIGHLTSDKNGNIRSKKHMIESISKHSEQSVGILLKEMMELHIPILLSYPDLLNKDHRALYQDEDYGGTVAATSSFIERFAFPKIYQAIKATNATSVIDFGAGYAGYLSRIGAKLENMKLVGIEKNRSVCLDAEANIHFPLKSPISLYPDDMMTWKWDGEPFDVAMMNNLLYYFAPEDRRHLFHKAYEVTGEKGQLIIITPMHESKHGHAFSAAFNSFMSAHDNLFPLPSRKEMTELAAESGFQLKQVKPVVKEGAWYFLHFQKV
ncbi:class I SAM-dependent methyltransferase [Bacillus sp. RAR_GA_16]|uniref:class I SAM-dependent methyltransferase n=1 Tax=Bacillus sp. RAR_GA_16 TaxID=2876774 RepID=UPI001CCB9CFA|nr:class I SAM-dependent methyltransferase [Bacillus sp. RAR_GA_16]MCA0172360.1 class I SAM-dependent methyltransferase [Bacillus sp. RAR_GA_16]